MDLEAPLDRVAFNIHLFYGKPGFDEIETCFAGLMAVRNNGKTMFLDPQTGDEHAEECFDWAELSLTRFWRIDNLQPSAMVMDCCLRETGEGDSYGRI